MALHVSEEEAIKRGWIPAPPPPPEPTIGPERIRQLTRAGRSSSRRQLVLTLTFIAGWLLGFGMATLFPR